MTSLRATPRRVCSASCAALAAVVGAVAFLAVTGAASAETAAGTVITNSSSASYQDANANSYGATSNTVSVTVQNAPSLTITAPSAQVDSPGQTITDSFTITNTGNAAGNVQFVTTSPGSGVVGGTDSSSVSTTTYTYGGNSYPSLAALNSALSSVSVAVNGSITVGVVYTLAASAGVGTVETDLTGTIAYAAVTGAAAATSSATSPSTYVTDSVQADALVDVALAGTNNSGVITYTVSAVNATSTWGAKDLTAVKTLLGSSSAGIFLAVKIPQVSGATLTTNGNVAITATNSAYGFASGAIATVYSTSSATGSSGWTAGTTPVSNATYIGVLISGGSCTINGSNMSGVEFCPTTGAGASPGTVPNPAITFTFSVNQSNASGSGNAGSTVTVANSLIGSNASTEYVIGPGFSAGATSDGTGITSTITASGYGINNTSAVTAGGFVGSGASGQSSLTSTTAYLVYNGPFGNPQATGTYDGVVSTSDNNHDFTAVSFVQASQAYTTTNTTPSDTPTTTSATTSAITVNVENSAYNAGNASDTYTIVANAPSNLWKVQLQSDNNGAPSGNALGGSSNSTTSTTASNITITSGGTLNYWAVYTAPAGTVYLSHGVATITITSNSNASISNSTANLLYAGFIAITTSVASTTPNCPAGTSPPAGSVCPGGVIYYSVDFRNIVAHSDASSVPAISFAGVESKTGTLVITADGTTSGGLANWASYTGGLNAAPVCSISSTTYTYYTGSPAPALVGAYTSGVTKFTAVVGGAAFQLVPYGVSGLNYQGTITYNVTAN